MTALFLSPHNDDETLFGAFTILREAPDLDVLVVYASAAQERVGILAETREAETRLALKMLGVTGGHYSQGWLSDRHGPQEGEVADFLLGLDGEQYERVYAPVVYGEVGGANLQHDAVGLAALDVFGDRVTGYHTYTHGRTRMAGPRLVEIEDADWVRAKLLALSCYVSQILEPSTGHHFTHALTEWYE